MDDFDLGHAAYRVIQLYIVMVIAVFIGVAAFMIFFNTGSITGFLPDSMANQIAVAALGTYVGLAVVVGIIIHGFNR